jgi:ADP-heptose:LPS heptosyltransferase
MKVRFLIIRFSSIGDIVLTTPVIRNLKNQVKGAEIHYLTKKKFLPVLKDNPYIDKLWLFEKDLKTLVREIKMAHPDYVIDLHNNLRSSRVKRKLGLVSFSFDKINLEKWLMVNLKKNRLPDNHIVDRYLETIKNFDVVNDMKGLDYFIDEEEVLPQEIRKLILNRFIALAIGAQHYTKKAPVKKLIEICDKLNCTVVILGGPGETEEANLIAQTTTNPNVIDLCGKISLNQSALLVKESSLLITHDTGLMHIGAAFKKVILSIWGNTIPEFGMYPYLTDVASRMFQVDNLNCRPCSKIGFQQCPKKHFDCMMKQNTSDIADYANSLLLNH